MPGKNGEKNGNNEPGKEVQPKETPAKETPSQEPGKETPQPQPGQVILTADQYNSLLDRMAELEDIAIGKTKETYSLEELAEEGKGPRRQSVQEEVEPEVDVDQMSNRQLVDFILGQGEQRLHSQDVKIETLRIMREIDKAEGDYEDFWQYEKAVRTIATANPTLSIDEAYVLAKQRAGVKEGETETPSGERRTTLYTLPPRQAIPSGEKPGVVPGSTTQIEVKTLKEAANKAWEEVVGKGKTVIE